MSRVLLLLLQLSTQKKNRPASTRALSSPTYGGYSPPAFARDAAQHIHGPLIDTILCVDKQLGVSFFTLSHFHTHTNTHTDSYEDTKKVTGPL